MIDRNGEKGRPKGGTAPGRAWTLPHPGSAAPTKFPTQACAVQATNTATCHAGHRGEALRLKRAPQQHGTTAWGRRLARPTPPPQRYRSGEAQQHKASTSRNRTTEPVLPLSLDNVAHNRRDRRPQATQASSARTQEFWTSRKNPSATQEAPSAVPTSRDRPGNDHRPQTTRVTPRLRRGSQTPASANGSRPTVKPCRRQVGERYKTCP